MKEDSYTLVNNIDGNIIKLNEAKYLNLMEFNVPYSNMIQAKKLFRRRILLQIQ